MSQTWSKNMEDRKHYYWKYIRNNLLAETYSKWKNTTPIIIPKKMQVVKIRSETEEQTRLRERQVISNFNFETEEFRLLTGSHLRKYKSCDDNMLALIDRKCTGEMRKELKELWKAETKRNEDISEKILNRKNKPFLQTYEIEFIEKYQKQKPLFERV